MSWKLYKILLMFSTDFTSLNALLLFPLSITFFPMKRMLRFIALLITIFVLIGTVFVIIWEMFHGRISLNLVVLLLLENFESGFRLELMYISHIEGIRSSLTHLHAFSTTCAAAIVHRNHFFCSSNRTVIVAKGFLKVPNLHILIKQKRTSLPRNLALGIFGELPIVFSTKVNLLYLLCSKIQRCCLLHLIKQNFWLKTFLRTLMTELSLYLFSLLELIWNCIIFPSKMVKKVIMNLDLSKASGPDCFPFYLFILFYLFFL